MEPRYYINPPKVCDVCGKPFGDFMADCKTLAGPWGNLCHGCWQNHGMPIGPGEGQTYVRVKHPQFTWRLIAGWMDQ